MGAVDGGFPQVLVAAGSGVAAERPGGVRCVSEESPDQVRGFLWCLNRCPPLAWK